MDLLTIDITKIEKIYSGKSGCMCGCRGKYTEGPGMKRLIANMIRYADKTGSKIRRDDTNLFVDDGVRNYVVYLKS